MTPSPAFRRHLGPVVLASLLLALAGCGGAPGRPVEPACRVAFDLGSSGIRAGASHRPDTVQRDQDSLGLLQADPSLAALAGQTAASLAELLARGGYGTACARVGGGFSVWRLALAPSPERLAERLADIERRSGVAILVLPQEQEGRYAYQGSRQLLGERLVTSHVLDIGGGSLQIAGAGSGWGLPLGQKAWHRELCRRLRGDAAPCRLPPLTGTELAASRRLLAQRLAAAAHQLPAGLSLTAVSRPVTRGIQPALLRLAPGSPADRITRAQLAAAIERLAPLDAGQVAALTGGRPPHLDYLLSDMLLVEGLMTTLGLAELQVREAALSNVPGLLADDRAYRWQAVYGCYLKRLGELGVAAYDSDPASCP